MSMKQSAWCLVAILLLACNTAFAEVIYVDQAMTGGGNDGASWASAYTNLDLALADTKLIPGGVEIWMAQGTYSHNYLGNGTNSFVLTNSNVQIYGGFTNGMTSLDERDHALYPVILDGQGIRQVLWIQSGDVTLDGLTIRNGKHPSLTETSGLLFYATPVAPQGLVMRNCTVESCTGSKYLQTPKGIAVSLQAGSGGTNRLENCKVINNWTPQDGGAKGVGIYASGGSRLEIVDCLVTNNVGGIPRYATLYGGGLHVDGVATVVVSNTLFRGNKGDNYNGDAAGGGALVKGATAATFEGCTFDYNQVYPGGSGAGLCADTASCQVMVRNCIFRSNVISYNNNTKIERGAGVCAKGGATVTLVNCTLVDNQTQGTGANAYGGGAVAGDGATVTVINSIFKANTAAEATAPETIMARNSATVSVSYSWLDGTNSTYVSPTVTLGAGIIEDLTGSPLFASLWDDLHLRSQAGRWNPATSDWVNDVQSSACIDAGTTNAPYNDYSAEPAYNGGRINMGAYGGTVEASKSAEAIAPVLTNTSASAYNTAAVLVGKMLGGQAGTVLACYATGTEDKGTSSTNDWTWRVATPSSPDQGMGVFQVVLTGLAENTEYIARFYGINANGEAWASGGPLTWTTTTAAPGGGGSVIHVDKDATGAQVGVDWVNAFTNLADGLAAVLPGRTTIWVAEGTYHDSSTLVINEENIAVYGGFAGTETSASARNMAVNPTVLDGHSLRQVVWVRSSGVTLDGLLIRNGKTAPSVTAVENTPGVLLYNSPVAPADFTMRGCTITNCTTAATTMAGRITYGYGLSLRGGGGTIRVEDCRVTGTVLGSFHGGRGIGVYADNPGGRLEIVGSRIDNNVDSATSSDQNGYGGGLYIERVSTALITNTVFQGNACGATGTGGGAYVSATALNVTFAGSTFAGNYVANNVGGGAAVIGATANTLFRNCIFVSNKVTTSGLRGGAVYAGSGATVNLVNCTLADNQCQRTGNATYGGGAVAAESSTVHIYNSIFHTNTAAEATAPETIYLNGGSLDVNFSWLDGTSASYVSSTVTLGDGIIGGVGEDPLFVAPYTDLHLKSRLGRWNPATSEWVKDSVSSLCIDAGSPNPPYNDYSAEPDYNGNRINLGAYGGTWQASKSLRAGTLISFM